MEDPSLDNNNFVEIAIWMARGGNGDDGYYLQILLLHNDETGVVEHKNGNIHQQTHLMRCCLILRMTITTTNTRRKYC